MERLRDQLKREIETDNHAFLASLESFRSLAPKRAAAVERLWEAIRAEDKRTSATLGLFSILTIDEIEKGLKSRDSRFFPTVKHLSEIENVLRSEVIDEKWREKETVVYVSDQLWLNFVTAITFRLRIEFEIHQIITLKKSSLSFEALKRIAGNALTEEEYEGADFSQSFVIPQVARRLDAAFLKEARRVLFGTDHFAASLSDTTSVLKSAKTGSD